METDRLPTQFAPAERAIEKTIRDQSRYFLSVPLMRQLFDVVPDIVLILNSQRQIVFANTPLLNTLGLTDDKAILGLRPGEALGCIRAFETAGGCGTSEFCSTCGAVKAILTSLLGQQSIQECRITQQNGEALDLQVWASPLEVNGELFSVFAVKDISHEKRRRSLERIFFHDLLNTAGGLQGFAHLLKDVHPGELDLVVEKINALSERLIDEINAQRELSLAENGEFVVRLAEINTLSLLQNVAALYANHEVAQGRAIQIDPQAEAIGFYSDEKLLYRVLGNMAKNALEASPAGGIVTLNCRVHPDAVEFTVHNPTFMPRQVQLQIFQRSFTTKGPGRGLGTYSIKLLSERYLRGRVAFTTSPEAGTTFYARYPLEL
jgi:signal transduction histidine kinase